MRVLLLAICFLTWLIVCSAGLGHQRSKIKSLSSHPVILIVSYDGFKYDYFSKAQATPWLMALRNSGVSVPYMEPTFPTKTFPNHQSISTGLYAETHGIVDNVVFDPEFNKTLSGYSDDPGFWNYHPDVLPIWILNELAGEGRVSGCMMWPGSSQPYGSNNDLLPTYYYPKYDGSVTWESRVDTIISWITDDNKPANLVFLYYDEPDTKGHMFGPNGEETLREVERADNRTAHLINKLMEAGVYDKINLILLSDHGMKEVTQERIIYLETLIDEEDLVEAKYGVTPVLQFVPNLGKDEDLYSNLTELSNNHGFTVWKREELKQPFYYGSSRRIADYVVIADPGFAFDDFNSTITKYNKRLNLEANETREYGLHGYSNAAASMRAFFIAYGPVFRRGFEFSPIKNVDIFPLISTILQLPEVPNNGSFSRVVEMIEPGFLSQISSGTTILRPLQILAVTVLFKLL